MKILLKITKYFLIIFLFIFIASFVSILTYSRKLNYTIPKTTSIEIYDNYGNILEKTNNQNNRNYVKINKISKNIINAFISIEDKEFYNHQGVNIKRIIGALINDIKTKDFSQGGSTITQQYVKNMFLTSDKTLKRKFDEALIAINIEGKYTKNEILEGYLNTIYFDHGVYGVEDASLFYFNKHASKVTLSEACILASIPKSPSNYSPIKNYDNNITRRNLILREMLKDELITLDEYNKALKEKVSLYGKLDSSELINAPYYLDCVLDELKDLNIAINEDIKIYTNYENTLNKYIIDAIDKYHPKNDIQIAVFAISNDGKVLSCIGGTNYLESTYNRAVKSLRQPGSTIKPFLYYSALNNGFNVSNTFYSTKTEFNINGISYSPKNYNDKYPETDVSMVYALSVSDNIYAIKTHLYLGTDTLYNTLKEFSFTSNINNNISLALGTSEVYLDELTTAYGKIASMGKDIKRKYIDKITDNDGNIIYQAKYDYKEKFNSTTCYILSETMTNVFDPKIRVNTSPTASSISSKLSKKYAAKSGSTDYDNWMIGFNKNITLGIWVGYDENIIVRNEETRFVKNIWADIMENYNKPYQNTWYETPTNVLGIKLNPINGKIATENEYSKYLYFENNNLPEYIK